MTPADVYVSTTSFATSDLGEIFEACREHGLDALELSAADGWDPSLLGKPLRPARLLVHNYFPPPTIPFVLNLSSQDSETLALSLAHCRAAIDLSKRLGGPVYGAHAGYAAEIPPEALGHPERQAALPAAAFAPYERTYATLVESAKGLARYAAARGVRFLIENHVLPASAGDAGRRLLSMVEADELERLCRDVDEPSFGLLVDTGHLKVSAATLGFDPHAFLDDLAPRIAALHLSDNDSTVDAHRPFGEDAWFLPRLCEFPTATVTLELQRLPTHEIATLRDMVAQWR